MLKNEKWTYTLKRMRRLEGGHNLTYYKCYAIFIQLTKIPKVHQNPGTYRGQNEHHVPRMVTLNFYV